MATNRHAQIRYSILDKCFSNFNRLYSYDDLLGEVNSVLYDIGTEGVKLRQLQYDIEHMKSLDGWVIQLNESLRKGRKKAFRYSDKNFSISHNPLNVQDSQQLESTIAILSRYKHREEFKWLEELIPRMQQSFDLVSDGDNGAIGYQQNIDLEGREYIGVLFNLIIKRQVTEIVYQPYGKDPIKSNVYPYHLKQYNNRWFLFCYNPQYGTISNYPLDRIKSIEEQAATFEPDTIDWEEYFDDFIGVTKPEDGKIVEIKLRFAENRINYVLTKPLHWSQKPSREKLVDNTISINVIPNREFYQLVLSFGEDVEVLSPKELRDEMSLRIKKMIEKY